MPRPIKQLHADADVVKELRRRSRSSTIGVRDRERAEMILRRLDGIGVAAVAAQLNTTPKRVLLWCVRFAASGLPTGRVGAARRRPPRPGWRAWSPR